MTQQDWLSSRDMTKLLAFIQPTADDRKARLFGVACCRRVWRLFRDDRARRAVEIAERYADGLADPHELRTAQKQAGGPRWTLPWPAAWHVTTPRINLDALASGAADAPGWFAMSNTPVGQEQEAQVLLCRDVFGNPFRPVEFSPGWRTADVSGIAHAVYADHAFDRMPILADALEDAGCTNGEILGHCRGPGPHIRGCWVVDLILDKE